ncbi:tumor necrosis factor receptor superfamily member 17 [Rhinophrynus dorsalis]
MAINCIANEYYDSLLQSCQSCLLRCTKKPPLPCRSYCADLTASPVILSVKDTHWIIWLLLAVVLVLVPTIFLITIVLRKKLKRSRNEKLHGDSLGGVHSNDKYEVQNKIEEAVLESILCSEVTRLKQPSQVEDPGCDICDKTLSDYLFPLPAVEEGATILVTTKTSACFSHGPGVRGNAFVEI